MRANLFLTLGALALLPCAAHAAQIFPPENINECAPGSLLSWDGMGKSVRCTGGVPIAFRATLTHQDVPLSEPTPAINYASVATNTVGAFDPATGVFTAPSDGFYHFDVVAGWHALPTGKFGQAGIDGSAGAVCYNSSIGAGMTHYISCSGSMQLAAGDTVYAVLYDNDSAADSWASVWFSGFKTGAGSN